MKRMVAAVLFVIWTAGAAWAQSPSLKLKEPYRQVVQGAMEEVTEALKDLPDSDGKTIAILPIAGDTDRWMVDQLRIALTRAGKSCVEAKEDPMWDEIMREFEWDARKEDLLDPSLLPAFGKLQTAQILLQAFIRSYEHTERYDFFEIELHATDIVTKRHLWGGVFSKRHYQPGYGEIGRTEMIPEQLRETMRTQMREKLAESIRSDTKLGSIRTVALLPLGADVKGYASGIVRDVLVRSDLTPVNLDLATLAEARLQLRDRPETVDALLHGSLRDLSSESWESLFWKIGTTRYRAEVQLCMETPSGEVLWSDTLAATEDVTENGGVWGMLCHYFPSLVTRPWLVVLVPLAFLIGLWILLKLLSTMIRVR